MTLKVAVMFLFFKEFAAGTSKWSDSLASSRWIFSSNRVSGSLMKRCATCWASRWSRPAERSHQAHSRAALQAPGTADSSGWGWRKAARSLGDAGLCRILVSPRVYPADPRGVSELCSPLKRCPWGSQGDTSKVSSFCYKLSSHKYLGLETLGQTAS